MKYVEEKFLLLSIMYACEICEFPNISPAS